ncbi:MAG: YigZ family protein [Actinomycetaceae bacterium]|nr:YigZ family protein [Actinomycetaceae bacterium]
MRSLRAKTRVRHEIVIQRSRFIASLGHTPSEHAARQFITSVREEFPDATHNCSAFVVKPEDSNEIGHSNDDGEPSGTAGMPMLEVLRRNNMVNVTAVVTRYFGGTLLGAGGLVRAYSTSVSETLQRASTVKLEHWEQWDVQLPHSAAGKFHAQVHQQGGEVVDTTYTEVVQVSYICPPAVSSQLLTQVAELTSGQSQPLFVSQKLVEIDEASGRPI